MSSFTTDQGIVHYEVLRARSPGNLATRLAGLVGVVAGDDGLPGRAITAPTRWIFGGLANRARSATSYNVQDFVSLVDQFMEQLGIERAPLVGHSMGGTVSLSVAIQYPSRVRKVVVIGSPIVGSIAFAAAEAVRPAAGGLRGLPQPVGAADWVSACWRRFTHAIRAGRR